MNETLSYPIVTCGDSGYGFTTTWSFDQTSNFPKIKASGSGRVRKGDRKAYESIWPGQFNRFNRKMK